MTEASEFEHAQFTAALEKLPLEYQPSKPLLQRYLSTPSLIRCMDKGFQDFISKKWRPTALDRFKPEKQQIEAELAALGEPVSKLSLFTVLSEVKVSCLTTVFLSSQVWASHIAGHLHAARKQLTSRHCSAGRPGEALPGNSCSKGHGGAPCKWSQGAAG